MNSVIERKEVHLDRETTKILKKQAEAEGRSLKNYMERVLIEHSKQLKSKSK